MTALRRRDHAYLVERLLPRQFLSAERDADLAAALAAGDAAQLHATCLAALRDLSALGLYIERPTPDPLGAVFVAKTTGDRIHLTTPPGPEQQASRPTPKTLTQPVRTTQTFVSETPPAAAEWRDQALWGATGHQAEEPETLRLEDLIGPEGDVGLPSTPPATATLPRAPLQDAATLTLDAPGTLSQLQGVFALAGIEERLTSLAERLRHILAQIESLFPGARAGILHLEGAASEELGNGPVRLLTRRELEATPHYRTSVQEGTLQLGTTAASNADLATGTLAAVAPLRIHNAAWGLLELQWQGAPIATARQAAPLLTHLARLVELAIHNQQTLEKLVFLDPLTGVYSRAFYERQLGLEMDRAHRTSRKFGLLVMDVDDFKSINDAHGHRAGDQVLAALAHQVRERMRKIDLLFRYGGEEFVAILPGADLEEARRTAERLRTVVAAHRFTADGTPTPLQVTISVGGAIFPDDARTPTGLFRHADGALYRAKEQGKNRVVFR